MRHGHGMRKLNRTTAHRLAMLRNMANSLLLHEAIKTTVPKAKELRRVVEPLITLGKTPTVANRRLAFNRLRDRAMVVKLFDEIGPMFKDRQGGYTRILKMGYRVGDNAPLAYMELVQKTTDTPADTKAKKPMKKAAPKPAAPAHEVKLAEAPKPAISVPEAKPAEAPKPAETKAEAPAAAPAEKAAPEAKPEEQPNPAESVPTEKAPAEEKPAE